MKGLPIKKILFRALVNSACHILGQQEFERILYSGCRNAFLRKCFRLGTCAYEFSAQIFDDGIRLAHFDHYSLYVNLLEPPGVSAYFFGYPDTLPFLDLILRKGDIVVDAGANLGQYTFLSTSLVEDTGRVFAFEPNEHLFILLKKSIAENKWEHIIIAENQALWNQQKNRVKFYLSNNPHNSGTSSLVFHACDISENHYIEVDTTTLDTYFHTHHISHCRFVKIDVERAEYELLQGFSTSLEQFCVDFILIEMYSHSPAHQVLSNCAYKGFLVEKGTGLIEIEDLDENHFGDYVFVNPQVYDEFTQIAPEINSRLRSMQM